MKQCCKPVLIPGKIQWASASQEWLKERFLIARNQKKRGWEDSREEESTEPLGVTTVFKLKEGLTKKKVVEEQKTTGDRS